MSVDLPGFADPVLEAQSAFRSILDAMSRPGTIHDVGVGLRPPVALGSAAAACLLTLVDAETSLHLDAVCTPAWEWVRFHCGPSESAEGVADFVLSTTMPELSALWAGGDDDPQGGATLILAVASFDRGDTFTVAGPGLRIPAVIVVDGLPVDFAERWQRNHARFPRGVDVLLCAGSRLMALPRSLDVARLERG